MCNSQIFILKAVFHISNSITWFTIFLCWIFKKQIYKEQRITERQKSTPFIEEVCYLFFQCDVVRKLELFRSLRTSPISFPVYSATNFAQIFPINRCTTHNTLSIFLFISHQEVNIESMATMLSSKPFLSPTEQETLSVVVYYNKPAWLGE